MKEHENIKSNRLKLVFPNEEYKEKIADFVQEFRNNGENLIPGSGGLDRLPSYEDWLKKINEDLSKEKAESKGRVQAKQYIAVRIDDDKVIGVVQVRYKLNEYLYNYGGHIGDAIRPSERNKGYSTEMIGLALKEAKKVGIGNVMMTCDRENKASARTIMKNGGVFENEVKKEEENRIIQRYWITLKKRFADGRNKKDHILEKDYKNIRVDDEDFNGNISLLEIKKVKFPWYVDEEKRCILSDGFKWLEIYPDGKNYSITVIYDENENVVEWYYDIARKIGKENGVPYEDDLYLDVVIVPDGRIHLLDEDELQEAYEKFEVNKNEYEMAYKVANELMKEYKDKENIEKLKIFSNKYLEILKNK